MAGKWRQLAPHFLAMFVIYVFAIVAVGEFFGQWGFLPSLIIALTIAFLYPSVVRSFGLAPEVWQRETDS